VTTRKLTMNVKHTERSFSVEPSCLHSRREVLIKIHKEKLQRKSLARTFVRLKPLTP